MAHRPQSPDGRPGRRGGSARPPRTRRGGDRAPYPGAQARTTGEGASETSANLRPGDKSRPSRRRTATASSAPTPVTVWTCGPDPIDSHAAWPTPIVETITAAFTTPGAHVVLVDLSTAWATVRTPDADGATAPSESALMAAHEAVRALDRTADTLTFGTRAEVHTLSSKPFWADMVTDSANPPAALTESSPTPVPAGTVSGSGAPDTNAAEHADLVVVSLPADAAETVSLDRLALLAADRLRQGGIFAVYTHSDWSQGRLVDPTGAIVAACQHADLLYLQHIVTLHTPIRDSRLHATPNAAVAADYHRTCHRATARGLPTPHLRVHGDVLVFAQPVDSRTAPPGTGSAVATHERAPRSPGSR